MSAIHLRGHTSNLRQQIYLLERQFPKYTYLGLDITNNTTSLRAHSSNYDRLYWGTNHSAVV